MSSPPIAPSSSPSPDTDATLSRLSDAPPALGTEDAPTIPGYEVLERLGRGGMGVVYKARHLALKRTVALKMIVAGAHAGEVEMARFRREAEAIAQLQHAHIVQVYEVGEWRATANGLPMPYLALEFCAGGSLDRHLNGTPLPPREAATLIEMLARAVHHAHQ